MIDSLKNKKLVPEIINALSNSSISFKEIEAKISDEIYNSIISQAESLYKNDKRERSLEEVIRSTLNGCLGEISILLMLEKFGFNVIKIDPESTGIYNYDLLISTPYEDIIDNGIKIEVKTKNYFSKNQLFSYKINQGQEIGYNSPIEFFRQCWNSYDLLLTVRIIEENENRKFIPWFIAEPEIFSSNIKPPYFIESKDYKGSWFLKSFIAKRDNLLIQLDE